MKSCRWQQTAKRLITFGLSLVLIWGLIPVGNAEEYAELLPPEVVGYLEAASEAYGVPVETLIENGILDGVDLSAWLEYQKELQRIQTGRDDREKAVITLDLANLTDEDWANSEYITFNKDGFPVIDLTKFLAMFSRLMNRAETGTLKELEKLDYEDTPHDGSGYIFREDFAKNAEVTVDDVYRALKAFIADQGKITIYKQFEEGVILYQDDFAALLLVLKYDPSGKPSVTEEPRLTALPFEMDQDVEKIVRDFAADILRETPGKIRMQGYSIYLAHIPEDSESAYMESAFQTDLPLPDAEEYFGTDGEIRIHKIAAVYASEDGILHAVDAEAETNGKDKITSVRFYGPVPAAYALCYTLKLEEKNPEENTARPDSEQEQSSPAAS